MNVIPTLDWLNRTETALIGMIHLEPLPGTPKASMSFQKVRQKALSEAAVLVRAGFDAIIVENMGDTPYLRREVPAEIVAAMTVVVSDICRLGLPVGVQVLAGANQAALAVATAAGACFIRAESYVFGHLADEGWMDADAGELLRYRRRIKSTVSVFCDIQKKHASHAASNDLGLADWMEAAEFCGADGVVVTGSVTGVPPSEADRRTLEQSSFPVLIGSGVTPENIGLYRGVAQGVIVGSYLKEDGHWQGNVCPQRAQAIRDALK